MGAEIKHDPFADTATDDDDELPSVHGDAPVVEGGPVLPLEVQIRALTQEVADGNADALPELQRLQALQQEQTAQMARHADKKRGAGKERAGRQPASGSKVARARAEAADADVLNLPGAPTPVPADVEGLSLEQKVDLVLRWMFDNAPKLDAVLGAYENLERARIEATAMWHYQCLECGTISEAPRPEARTSPDQAVRCPNCFPSKGLTPHDVVELRQAV